MVMRLFILLLLLRLSVSSWVPQIKGIVFDFYGTIADLQAIVPTIQSVVSNVPADAFNNQWRLKQLEYTFLRTIMDKYQNFWVVTEEALEYTLERYQVSVSSVDKARLMDSYNYPVPHPEAKEALQRLRDADLQIAILSNGDPTMLEKGLERANLKIFHKVISVDEIKTFKPNPEVYSLAQKTLHLSKEEILFVTSNPFDAMGAKNYGYRVAWINRKANPFDKIDKLLPDLELTNLNELPSLLISHDEL